MPVIVVGADTEMGEAIMDALLPRSGEVRAFVTSPESAAALRARDVKVALGDVSDGSHIGGAALNAFCAVLIGEATRDTRERSFADDPESVLAAWVEGLNEAGIQRAIFVGERPAAETVRALQAVSVHVATDQPPTTVAAEVAGLEDAAQVPQHLTL